MQRFLNSYFSSLKDLKIEKLKGDGGHRSYFRLIKSDRIFILMACGPKDSSLEFFIKIQQRLKNFVQVPQIFHYDLKSGYLILEDLGDETLEAVFFQKDENRKRFFYEQALKQLLQLQTQVKAKADDLLFDKNFFLNEIEQAVFDLETYLKNFLNIKYIDQKLSADFKKEINEILSGFKAEDYVYCHRDYHSRNLMLKSDKVFMIDFQDAGQGPFFYDLSSLLYDSYVSLEDKPSLLEFYFKSATPFLKKKIKSLDYLEKMTKLQFLQRGFKACGRFSAFKNENNKDSHLKYLSPSLQLLKETAREFSYEGIYNYARFLIQTLTERDHLEQKKH